MNKTKLYKLIFIIAIYSAAFTLLLISIKNYTSYLSTYKNNNYTTYQSFIHKTHQKSKLYQQNTEKYCKKCVKTSCHCQQ